jgi:hypothetical protein
MKGKIHGPYVDFVCEKYSMFEEECKYLSPFLFSLGTTVVECIPKFEILKNPCNLDPWGHYSSLIEATLLLDRKYLLSLPERLLLLRAMAVTPNSTLSICDSRDYPSTSGRPIPKPSIELSVWTTDG